MKSIDINNQCVTCGKCVMVCPAYVFEKGSDDKISVTPDNCISCGHCVAVCPKSAITHSDYPTNRVHKIDFSKAPSPEQLDLLLKIRRSNRAFSNKAVPKEVVSKIIEAAHRAPTASNKQGVEYTIVSSPEKLKAVTEYTLGVFGKVARLMRNPLVKMFLKRRMPDAYRYLPVFDRLIDRYYNNGEDGILRGATSLIFIHSPANSAFYKEDSNLAYQNASLMAESLGISQFYLGFVIAALSRDKSGKLYDILNLQNRKIGAAMAIGVPLFKYDSYIDRKDVVVTEI